MRWSFCQDIGRISPSVKIDLVGALVPADKAYFMTRLGSQRQDIALLRTVPDMQLRVGMSRFGL